MKSSTESSCTVPWVLDDTKVCTSKQDMNNSYWTHYTRITNQQAILNLEFDRKYFYGI